MQLFLCESYLRRDKIQKGKGDNINQNFSINICMQEVISDLIMTQPLKLLARVGHMDEERLPKMLYES